MTDVHVVRVFTDEYGRHGNHLGVVLDSAGLDDARRQQIATQLGFSETVFVDDVEEARLRIFTPSREIPLVYCRRFRFVVVVTAGRWVRMCPQRWRQDRRVPRPAPNAMLISIHEEDKTMADKEMIQGLLQGTFDTHVHSGPDLLPRKFNDIQLAEVARDRGFGGIVLKSHHVVTADRATLIKEMYPGVNVYGAIALNNPVGGLNPTAIDIAGRLGARVCWLPTCDSANEQANVAGQLDESKLPYWMSIARELREAGIAGSYLTVTDGNGTVLPEMQQCLEVIAKYDMVMATGHINPSEMEPVVKAAKQAGVQRIIITHPEFPTTHLSLEDQKNLQQYGVYFERVFTTPHTNKCSWDETLNNIQEIGPSSTIAATDLGQTINPGLEEGFEIYIGKMLDHGFTEAQIKQMTQHNAAALLGAK